MRYRRTSTFKKCFHDLPDDIQRAAKESFKLFKDNPIPPYHPSLRIRKMKGYPGVWEGHVTRDYVFTLHEELDPGTEETVIVFRKIGKHDIYRNP